MNLNEYQSAALKTAIYPFRGTNFTYPALGLCGEAGEVAEKCKKIIRDQESNIYPFNIEDIKKELGDTLWYLAVLADEFNIELEDVAKTNIEKLSSRQKRNKIKGEGDNR
jgi:NTP pyrophosphatase (non-canonical NTP hydrolase)